MGKIIDVHHHILPEEYVNASGTIPHGLTPPPWSPELDLEFMDRNGIDTAILSLSAPGLSFLPPTQAATVARQTNATCAAVRDAYPGRFGFFATLPLLDDNSDDASSLPATLTELAHALDELYADGVTLLTSYGGDGGAYLGDARFRPLWAELDRRQAVVFVHPASPPPKPKDASADRAVVVPPPIIDFPHETTRAAVNLITSNIRRDYPHVKIILSHGGGTLPFVATRIANLMAGAGLLGDKSAEEFLREARSFYFDVALTGYEGPLGLVLEFAEEGHVLFGSDFSFAREKIIVPQLETIRALGEGGMGALVERGAALGLFPRLGL
ncbi:hypothetical protein C8A00DRAFT_45221 [Chaetomidium leptoderma]|uniref:6-methylsalicylate decarboxylase n=1 Tax=Chaetomidium leptoderma TaxID=669021 RepID=A0AAN6ZTR8_9PEZI|nr:hypothetical protein C8A00DRAFT_45221 [Chaetomidium leptoderma]